MSLTNFKPWFDNTYEEIFQKVLVGKEIANLRFEKVLTYGASVERVAYDISGVYVRTVSRTGASTIDSITDSNETLLVNLSKEAVFFIHDDEVKQAGPLNPGEVIGGKIAIKVAADLDARIFAEVLNAAYTFDNGDLTTLASTGAGITVNSTTVPQMVPRMPAKLRHNNIILTDTALVLDSYAGSDVEQFLLGKQFSVVESVFKNGYAGPIATAQVYISENLTGQALLTLSGAPTDGDTVTVNGVVFTAKTTLSSGPAIAGEVIIGSTANASAFLTNLAAAVNAPGTTTATFTALSAAHQAIVTSTLGLAATATATTIKLVGTGSGRMVVAKSMSVATITYNIIHCYFGKKGAIDVVVQDMKEVDMRATVDRRGTNVFSSYLAGIKTFVDGSKKFLDVWVNA